MVFPGWEVTRVIPHDVVMGLLTGQYKLYGGVIRWAAGTENAGQIVRHLAPISSQMLGFVPGLNSVSGVINTIQIHHLSTQVGALSQATQQILHVAAGTAALSGLGLVVSCVGFATINNRLKIIDGKLKDIQKDIQAIKEFLASSERARLFAALDSLVKLEKTPVEHRGTILHQARQTLTEISVRYRELLTQATALETAMAYEEFFVLTSLAQIRCTAELRMFDVALDEVEEINQVWQIQGRRVAKEILVGEHPERFLATDFVDSASIAEVVEWLDFINEEAKGYARIDDLRRKLDETWYSKGWKPIKHSGSGLNKNVGVGLEKEQTMVIPSLKKLIARSNVFEGYVDQYHLLAAQNATPTEFEQKIRAVSESSTLDGYIILEPAQPVLAPAQQVLEPVGKTAKRQPFSRSAQTR